MNDKSGLKGQVEIILRDASGKIKAHETMMNAITNIGFDQACALLGDAAVKLSYIGIGYGAGSQTAFDPVQTDLQGASKLRQTVVYTHTGGTKVFQLATTFGVGVPAVQADIGEIGVFWGASGANMFSRLVRSVVLSKLTTDSLEIRWTLTFS